jgi:hypothetical protein
MGTIDDLAAAREPQVATTLRDGTAGWVPFWVVRVGDGIYARSHRGPGSGWYSKAAAEGATTLRLDGEEIPVTVTPIGAELRAEIDAAYEAKYASDPADAPYVAPMLSEEVVATTVRLTPA